MNNKKHIYNFFVSNFIFLATSAFAAFDIGEKITYTDPDSHRVQNGVVQRIEKSGSIVVAFTGTTAGAGSIKALSIQDQEHVQLTSCSVCQDGDHNQKRTYCPKGHLIHKGCLVDQINGIEITKINKAKEIQEKGLPCIVENCKKRLSIQNVEACVGAENQALQDLRKRLNAAISPCSTSNSSLSHAFSIFFNKSTTHDGRIRQIKELKDQIQMLVKRELKDQIQEAFTICCPECKGTLDVLQNGDCDSAVCDKDNGCGSNFCYLCLQKGEDKWAVHRHAMIHSGNYWDKRDGHTGSVPNAGQRYTEVEEYEAIETDPNTTEKRKVQREKSYRYRNRYHWLITRAKLESILRSGNNLLPEVLRELEPILREAKMWPVPTPQNMDQWIQAVMNDPRMDRRNKIALLQNEFIFQNRIETSGNNSLAKTEAAQDEAMFQSFLTGLNKMFFASSKTEETSGQGSVAENKVSLQAALTRLNAPVLTSLDLNAPLAPKLHVRDLPPRYRQGNISLVSDKDEEWAQIPNGLKNLGRDQIYRAHDPENKVPDFILSGVAPNTMKHADAVTYCKDHGARLPTQDEFKAFARAMGFGQPEGYQGDLIPDMDGWFWSSSVDTYDSNVAFYFTGRIGNVVVGKRSFKGRVRCIVDARPQMQAPRLQAKSQPQVPSSHINSKNEVKVAEFELKAPTNISSHFDIRSSSSSVSASASAPSIAQARVPQIAQVQAQPPTGGGKTIPIQHVVEGDENWAFIPEGLKNMGRDFIYRIRDPESTVPDFILSYVASSDLEPIRMSYTDAVIYCSDRGARLPTQDEFEALARAMGLGQTGGYQKDLIPNMDSWFWSVSVDSFETNAPFHFEGRFGEVNSSYHSYFPLFVRCVVDARPQVHAPRLQVQSQPQVPSSRINSKDEKKETEFELKGPTIISTHFGNRNSSSSSSSSSASAPSIAQARTPTLTQAQVPQSGQVQSQPPAGRGRINPVQHVLEGDENWADIPKGMRNIGPEKMFRIHDPQGKVPDFILSHIAPRNMKHADAVVYCRDQGARLPTKEEYEALGRALGLGQPGGYEPHLIHDWYGWFWSASVHTRDTTSAFYFAGTVGNVAFGDRNFKGRIRCIVDARLQVQAPRLQNQSQVLSSRINSKDEKKETEFELKAPTIMSLHFDNHSSSSSAASSAPLIAKARTATIAQAQVSHIGQVQSQPSAGRDRINPIQPVVEGDENWTQVPDGMRNMGLKNMYRIHDPQGQVPDFILSHVAPRRMNHTDAVAYCRDRGARLPTKEEYEALGRGPHGEGYKHHLIPEMDDRWFWTDSSFLSNTAKVYRFFGSNGHLGTDTRYNVNGSVRCVVAVQ